MTALAWRTGVDGRVDHVTGIAGLAGRSSPDVHPCFFLTGIIVALTAGATWGAIMLLRIAANRSFTSVAIFDINAHAQAQIYGWGGMFVMGFAYRAFPRFWQPASPCLVSPTARGS